MLDQLVSASGVATVVVNLVKGIHDCNQDIAVYGTCEPRLVAELTTYGATVHQLPYITAGFGLHFVQAFRELLRDQQYDVVHGHLINSAFIYLSLAKRLGVSNRIIHAHSAIGSDSVAKRLRNKLLALPLPCLATTYVSISPQAAKASFGRTRATRIIPNGIDTARFAYNPKSRHRLRHELAISDTTLCVGHVGRFSKLKNHGFLLAVFHQLRSRQDCVLLLAGEGPLEQQIRAQVVSLGLTDSVRFLGPRTDIENIYQAMDVLVMPSLSEGFGLAALEGYIAGLACVLSNRFPVLSADSSYMVKLPLENSVTWVTAILNAPKLRNQQPFTEFTTAQMCEHMYSLYKGMVSSHD